MTLQQVRVSWPQTGYSDFTAYRVWRDGDLIGRLTDQFTTELVDVEGRRGVPHDYSVSVERSDGAWSVPTDAGQAVIAYAVDCEWALTSNVEPGLSLTFQADRDRRYTFRSDRTRRRLFSRPMVAEFKGTEDRGDEFSLTVVLGGEDTELYDRDLYDRLLAIANADLPYVCVLNPYGRRWFATVEVQEAAQSTGDALGLATLFVSQSQLVPYVVS